MSTRRQETQSLVHPAEGTVQAYLSSTGEPADWAMLYVHGFGSARTGEKPAAFEAACARRGWTFASFDFRGHGQSSGNMLQLRAAGLLEDLNVVWQYLAGRGVRRLGLVGSSMGAWASAWFSVRVPESVLACVCLAPAFNFFHYRWACLSESERQTWKQTGRLRVRNRWVDTEVGYGLVEELDQFPVGLLAVQLNRPLLIFHGVLDDIVPYTHSLALVEQAVSPEIELRLWKSADHRLLAYKDEMAEEACRFFARWL
jgi:pimeloyl-ACP methyl ester carboxylesterase